ADLLPDLGAHVAVGPGLEEPVDLVRHVLDVRGELAAHPVQARDPARGGKAFGLEQLLVVRVADLDRHLQAERGEVRDHLVEVLVGPALAVPGPDVEDLYAAEDVRDARRLRHRRLRCRRPGRRRARPVSACAPSRLMVSASGRPRLIRARSRVVLFSMRRYRATTSSSSSIPSRTASSSRAMRTGPRSSAPRPLAVAAKWEAPCETSEGARAMGGVACSARARMRIANALAPRAVTGTSCRRRGARRGPASGGADGSGPIATADPEGAKVKALAPSAMRRSSLATTSVHKIEVASAANVPLAAATCAKPNAPAPVPLNRS